MDRYYTEYLLFLQLFCYYLLRLPVYTNGLEKQMFPQEDHETPYSSRRLSPAKLMQRLLNNLRQRGETARAQHDAKYHRAKRAYLGVPVPAIGQAISSLGPLDDEVRLELARTLWKHDIYETRIAAPRLLKRNRLQCDAEAWKLMQSWAPDFDSWAIADAVASAGALRLIADPARLDDLESWTQADNFWIRRAALIFTLPWARRNLPSTETDRDRILGWAAGYVSDPEWFIQKAIAWWVRELSRHNPARARKFLAAHAASMKPFAVREASRLIK